jgi:mono/diheme cytochrome c family protein
MIRHILAALGLVVTLGTFWHLISIDKEIDALGKVDEIFRKSELLVELGKKSANSGQLTQGGSAPLAPIDSSSGLVEDNKKSETEDKLKALKEKAGNIGGFKVSILYKSKCSSCHGYNGEGGVGPKLIGHTEEKVLTMLTDFKSGSKKNYVMYGLLQNLSDEDLKTLAKEIGEFAQKAEALNK